MKLVNQVLDLMNEVKTECDCEQVVDYLSNSIENAESELQSISDLTDMGMSQEQAKKLISSYWKLSPKDRSDFGLNTDKAIQWVKEIMK